MTRTDRRRFPVLLAVIAALAMAMLFSPVQAQEGSAPDKPRGLEATASHDSVTLTWDDSDDDSITGYVILRRVRVNNTGGEFSELVADTGTAALTYTDDTVAAGLTYTYRIKAINEHGVSERSRWSHIDTPEAPVPDKPRGLEATATHDSVTLTWDDPGDDSITGYVILRRVPAVDPQGQFSELDPDTGTDATTYTDYTVSAETRYTYRIKAINQYGASERSRWSHINVPAAPEPTPAASQSKSGGTQQDRSNHEVDICNRTPEFEAMLLAGIQADNPSVTCSTVTPEQLAGVTMLSVVGYSSASIVPSDFDGLTGLSRLTIENSQQLTSVPANAFAGLDSLTRLDLPDNGLSLLDPDAFAGLSSLTHLYLTNNALTWLPSDVFDDLSSLRTLWIEDNALTSLPMGIFDGLSDLTSLRLFRNALTSLDPDLFDGLSSLDNIGLNYNDISSLDEDLFDGLTSLQRLYLDHNQLNTLPADIFNGLTVLKSVYLNSNQFTSLPEGIFTGRTALTSITLSDNEIDSLPENTFEGLSNLTQIRLTGNDFSSLDEVEDLFGGLTSLQRLYLDENELSTLPEDVFDGLTALRWLYLNENDISSLDEDLFDGLTSLQRLYLNENDISSLDEDLFDGLTSLQWLYLNENDISSLDEDLFDGLTSLQWLYLHGNILTTLPGDVFDGLSGLEQLYLHDNSLTTLPEDVFGPLDDSLTQLDLSDNNINSLHEDVFDGLTGLELLYLHDNSLTTLPEDVLYGLSSLEDLNLDANMLNALAADVFDGLDDSLTDLYLRDNSLTALPEAVFDGLTGLQGLDLSCNALTALDLDEFDPFAATLTYLDLGANSFTTPLTETAVKAKLMAIEALYLTGGPPCLPAYDVGLSALSLSTGTLSPVFEAPGRSSGTIIPAYTATVGNDNSLTITTSTRGANARIDSDSRPFAENPVYDNDPDTPGIQVDLRNTQTDVWWKVTAANGLDTAYYAVTVFREHPKDAILHSLEVSGLTLTPEFSSTTYDYQAQGSASETTVTAIATDPEATIEYLDSSDNTLADADSTEDGHQVDLDVGDTVFKVKVTAEDTTTTQTYTVTVTQAACTLNTGDIWCGVVTVGELKTSADVLVSHGFADTSSLSAGGLVGNPGDTMFSVGDNDYTIRGLYVGAPGGNNDGSLFLLLTADLSDDDKENLVFKIDGVTTDRALSDASRLSTGLYSWANTGLDWSSTTTVTVRLSGSTTPDDFPSDNTTTGQVDVGGSVTGNMDSVFDIDWFRVDLKKDKRYQIDLEGADTNRGTLTDPVLSKMRDALGNVVTDALDSGIGNNARRIFTAPADGTHYVVASSNGVTGTYTLSVIVLGANGVSEADTDFPATTATTGRVDVGASVTGYINPATDIDGFLVDLQAGKTYQIDMEGSPTGRGTLADPGLNLYDDSSSSPNSSSFIASDNDGGEGYNSRLTFRSSATGTYLLTVEDNSRSPGTYTLSVRDITPPPDDSADPPADSTNVSEPDGEDLPEGITTTGRVEVGGSVTGEIAPALDVDWFAVELKKGKRYQFDVEGADTGRGNLADPHLWGLQDAGGQAVEGARSNDGGVGKNGRVINTPDAEGTYYIAVAGAASTTGTYTLSVIVLGANGASEANTDFPRDTTTTGRVEVGASATGNIDPGEDLDGFRVNLEAGKRYRFDLEGADTGRGSQADPILALYGDSFNVSHYIDEDDDGGEGLNSRLTYTATATGIYHLEVAGLDPGAYTLSVREILLAVAVPPGGLGPSEIPGAVRNVSVSYSRVSGIGGQIVWWDAPDETGTGAQWITEFRIYGSTSEGCGGYLLDAYEVEHPGSTTPPEINGVPTGFKYFKIVYVGPVKFGVAAVNELGEGPCVEGPDPPGNS